jgi:hypothetical protein
MVLLLFAIMPLWSALRNLARACSDRKTGSHFSGTCAGRIMMRPGFFDLAYVLIGKPVPTFPEHAQGAS